MFSNVDFSSVNSNCQSNLPTNEWAKDIFLKLSFIFSCLWPKFFFPFSTSSQTYSTANQIKVWQTIMIYLSCGWHGHIYFIYTVYYNRWVKKKKKHYSIRITRIFFSLLIASGNCVLSIFSTIQYFRFYHTYGWNCVDIERINLEICWFYSCFVKILKG